MVEQGTNTAEIDAIRNAILAGASGRELESLPLPRSVRGALVKADEVETFAGVESADKDPRKSTHVEPFPLPELAPDEAFVGVMASAINFNTVWTSIFEPLPTFGFLKRLGRESVWGARHDLPYHVMGSDAAGVVLRVGSAVRNWKPGDRVTVHCLHVDDQDPSAHDDSTSRFVWPWAPTQRWYGSSCYGARRSCRSSAVLLVPRSCCWRADFCAESCSASARMIRAYWPVRCWCRWLSP